MFKDLEVRKFKGLEVIFRPHNIYTSKPFIEHLH